MNGANFTRVLISLWALGAPAWAADVSVVALFPGKAMLVIDKGKPRTLRASETFAGVTLVTSNSTEAIISINGKQQKLHIGEGVYSALSVQSDHATAILASDRNVILSPRAASTVRPCNSSSIPGRPWSR